ncbi:MULTISPECIES: hypothetical protein [Actinomadura]|uniref:Uncharacterized protein n=1 Tax=Actinomadura yumaensis TaxID=111807 RepID=A0ABW2CR88_9ACTN|nr:hypothetical protein [Actinomadura sp. J1-007]MWK34258.1 hypothetical protein [Actinomadura sp. J1-007]
MTTVILVLLCLAIAGRELYLASDKRLPRAQAELRELHGQVAELAKRHEALQAEVAAAAEPGIAIPQPLVGEPAVAEAAERLASLTGRVEHLEKEIDEVSSELSALELDREAQRALARSLDSAEQDIRELHREMLDRLDRQEGVVTGLLLSEEGEAEALLAEAYERCASEYGLRVRIRDERSAQAAGGGYWGTAYRLSGRRSDALADDLFTHVRGLYDPQDPSALTALLVEFAHLRGGGVARFGPFTIARTPSALVCGVLPDDQPLPGEPWELASRLRELPEEFQCDLSWLRTED